MGAEGLYRVQAGRGPELVLVHGWGMHSGVWEDVAEDLVDHYRLTLPDLPGHGYSRRSGAGHTLGGLARALLAAAPARAAWVGWSLGGLAALRAALDAPERVERLVLVAASPCFVRRPDWPQGMAPETLHQFAGGLAADYRQTIRRFLALEVHGGEGERDQLRLLRAMVFQHGEPDPAALADGLRILETADLRRELPRLACPLALLMGRRDALVPAGAGAAIQALLPAARLHRFERAGHAPFFSHREAFVQRLRGFLHD